MRLSSICAGLATEEHSGRDDVNQIAHLQREGWKTTRRLQTEESRTRKDHSPTRPWENAHDRLDATSDLGVKELTFTK